MTNLPDWTSRPYLPEDAGDLVDLLHRCLGPGSVPRNTAFWRWKHETNPFGPSAALLACHGDTLVGVRAFLRWRWWCGDRPVEAVRAVDTATHPDWRGRGVFTTLTRTLAEQVAAEGVTLVFNTPNQRSGPGYLKMGWQRVGRLRPWVRPLFRRGLHGAEAPESMEDFLADPSTAPFLERVEAGRRDGRLRTALTSDYLHWRYAAVPGVSYGVLRGGGGDARAALVIRHRRRRRLREVSVSEVLVAADDASVGTASELLRRLGGAAVAVALASRGTPEARALRRAGFLQLPFAGPSLYVRCLARDGALPDLTRLSRWRLSVGSFELF